jgi:hypothetical protein
LVLVSVDNNPLSFGKIFVWFFAVMCEKAFSSFFKEKLQ